ncbi:MAG: 2-hydroxyacyl-CoA dehydratase family protein [Candidatus Alcyoniella australis]|nr:2-hydroxyacyl-CoA dehydratase family protein [Candidatus Alcyoniella australis]
MYSEQVGLFDRVASILDLCKRMPDTMSDEEVEGLLKFLPTDSQNSIRAMLVPRFRDVSVKFLKLVAKWVHTARKAPLEGKKVIIVPFNFPPELIHAFDNACPITSEILSTLGVVALEGQGERYWDMAMGLGLPDHSCSSSTIELGSMLGSSDFRPQAIVSAAPGGCDVNAKIHEFVSNYLDIPQFFLAKIPDDSQRGHAQYSVEARKLIKSLEQFVGEELTEDKLRKVMERANRCTELHYELWDLQRARPCPVPNLFSLYLYGVRFSMWGTQDGIEMLEAMVDLAKQRLKQGAYPAPQEKARTLWCYTSYYFDFANLFNWMEESGYTHLGDGLDLYFPQPVDTSSMDSMIEGFAEAARNMPMTRQVGGQSMSGQWTEDCITAAQQLDADCVIYCGHHSCKQTWSVLSILRSEIERRTGLPMLVLQGDSWIRRMTPISVIQHEIDEFVQNVVARKEQGKRRSRKHKSIN